MAAPLTVGDKVWFNGAMGTVVATTATTDASTGEGSITYGGQTYTFKAMRATGPDVPLVAADDDWFRVGLLQHPDGDKYALVLDDPQEGRLIRARTGSGANDQRCAALQDHQQLFVTCWEARGRVLENGTPLASVPVDFELQWSCSEGAHVGWWQPTYSFPALEPSGSTYVRSGSANAHFATDTGGYVADLWNPQTTRVLLPRGHGAWGQRATDRMWQGPDAPAPERYLLSLRLCCGRPLTSPYLYGFTTPEQVEVSEGAPAVLDLRSCTINVTAPPQCAVRAQWRGTLLRAYGATGAGTSVSLTGLPAGEWDVTIGEANGSFPYPNANWALPARQSVALDVGETAALDFGTTKPSIPANTYVGHIYWYGAEPAAGVSIAVRYTRNFPSFLQFWRSYSTDDAGAYSFPASEAGAVVDHIIVATEKGYWHAEGGASWNVALGARFALNGATWGPFGTHPNVRAMSFAAYLTKAGKDAPEIPFVRDEEHGWLYTATQLWDCEGETDYPIKWDVHGAGGEVRLANVTSAYESGSSPYNTQDHGNDLGGASTVVLGGVVHGNILGTAPDRIEADRPLLEDAARMGAERGKLAWGVESRWSSPTAEDWASDQQPGGSTLSRAIAVSGMQCPYCGGPIWRLPDTSDNKRGYCQQCALAPPDGWGIADATEARTYFETPTLPSFDDWQNTIACVATSGSVGRRTLIAHWRPEGYREVDGYLGTEEWLGPAGAQPPRWVAVHYAFATWGASGFVDGTDIVTEEAALPATLALRRVAGHCPATIGPCQLKAIAADGYQYGGAPAHFRATCVRPDGSSADVDLTIPSGFAGAGVGGRVLSDFVRLSSREQVDSDAGFSPTAGFYTDVTHLVCLGSPAPGGLQFTIVNDAPHRCRAGAPVTELAAEPYLVLLPAEDEGAPCLCRDAAGRIHRFLRRGGAILHEVLASRQVGWEGVELASDPAHMADTPSGALLPDGTLLCTYQWSGSTVLRRSRDDGATWETVGALPA